MTETTYDIAIIGGGLAGLALAIEQSRSGRKVILFEKKAYPYHKVCGEYISNESRKYIESLGVNLKQLGVPQIDQLQVTALDGTELNHHLELGGFGISRYTLDYKLAQIAKSEGVHLMENTTVLDFEKSKEHFSISTKKGDYHATLLVGAHGKRSSIDKSLNRSFISKPLSPSKNFIGIKYHVKADLPENLIGLHIFKDGYCGISKIEDSKYCMCYLTLQSNLDNYSSIEAMENDLLSRNEKLASFLKYSSLYEKPLVISQVNFSKKQSIEQGVFMVGDAAGLIVPLCGNGMSMALHSSYQLSLFINDYYSKKIGLEELEALYTKWWNKQFNLRLKIGRLLQNLIYSRSMSRLTIKFLNRFPAITKKVIRLTHGKEFGPV